MAKVRQSGIKALQEINVLNLTPTADMIAGKFVGMDANGNIILATNVSGANVRAVAIVKEGSEEKFGEGWNLNPDRPLRAKRGQDLDKFYLFEDDSFTHAQAMVGTPVYLGLAGGFTTTAPTGTGVLKQVVGYVLSKGVAFIDLTKDPAGTVL